MGFEEGHQHARDALAGEGVALLKDPDEFNEGGQRHKTAAPTGKRCDHAAGVSSLRGIVLREVPD
ncbi:hypothetical protein D3C85_1681290 [compost metagenome]